MNEQELINYTKEEQRAHQESSDFQLGYRTAMKRVFAKTIELDELRKPVIPRAVADWYENNKYTFEYSLAQLINDYYKGAIEDDNLRLWFGYNLDYDKPIETLVNVHQLGYKVYEEKLYTAKLKSTGEYLHYEAEIDEVHHFRSFDSVAKRSKNYHFTEDELLKYNAWGNSAYEVEEVEK